MNKKNKILLVVVALFFAASCDTYPDYETEYSPAYPIAGEYLVKDYGPDSLATGESRGSNYDIFIYSASFDAEKYLWVNSSVPRFGAATFRVKTEYNISNLTFDGTMLAHAPGRAEPPEVPTRYVTITRSVVTQKEWPTPDSIQFHIQIFDEDQELTDEYDIAGHRTRGTETPFWDNHE